VWFNIENETLTLLVLISVVQYRKRNFDFARFDFRRVSESVHFQRSWPKSPKANLNLALCNTPDGVSERNTPIPATLGHSGLSGSLFTRATRLCHPQHSVAGWAHTDHLKGSGSFPPPSWVQGATNLVTVVTIFLLHLTLDGAPRCAHCQRPSGHQMPTSSSLSSSSGYSPSSD
jgi:hypothetical protein